MCGIVGFLSGHPTSNHESLCSVAERMADKLSHRGPDAHGVWCSVPSGIALGHRRLSILDLSPLGAQPMMSNSGRYVMALNGEIYNFRELRSELERIGHAFRGHSDTEVALAAFEQWGIEESVRRFNGMFAFAVWDSELRRLYLSRDRMGEKPLYYGWAGTTFLFASELKAFHAHPHFIPEIDLEAVSLFLQFGYVPTPHAIYKGVRKLPAGQICCVDNPESRETKVNQYWSLADAVDSGFDNPFRGDEEAAFEHLRTLLTDAIRSQMISDVPLGAFLSGGIDSSLVVSLMQELSEKPVKTFTIGFIESRFDEAACAKEVSQYLHTQHEELYVTPKEAMSVVPKLPLLYDEPFSDSSQIPTYLVAKLARRHVTVALSGDAGDELFGGYNRYLSGERLWNTIARFPGHSRKAIGKLLTLAPAPWLNKFFGSIRAFDSEYGRPGIVADKLHKLGQILDSPSAEQFYWGLATQCQENDSPLAAPLKLSRDRFVKMPRTKLKDFTQLMMYVDALTYLPDDILVKVDRAAMGVGLETRVPFLDYRVVEFAWRLPMSMKVQQGQGKRPLRALLYRSLPSRLFERPKHGFGVPIGEWLRGPLREWAEDLLDENRILQDGLLDAGVIRKRWKEHLSGRRNSEQQLWTVLMLQAWLRSQSELKDNEWELQLT